MSWKKIITASSSDTPPLLTPKDLLAEEPFVLGEILKLVNNNGPQLQWHKDQEYTDSGYDAPLDDAYPTNVTGSVNNGLGLNIHSLYGQTDASLSFGPYTSQTYTIVGGANGAGVCSDAAITTEADCLEAEETWTYGYTPDGGTVIPAGNAATATVIKDIDIIYNTHNNGIVSDLAGDEAVFGKGERILYMKSDIDPSGNSLKMGTTGTDGYGASWDEDTLFTGSLDANYYVHTSAHPARTDDDEVIATGAASVGKIRMYETVNKEGHLTSIGTNAQDIDIASRTLLMTDLTTVTAGHESLGTSPFGTTIALSAWDPTGAGADWVGTPPTETVMVMDPAAGNTGANTSSSYADFYGSWNFSSANQNNDPQGTITTSIEGEKSLDIVAGTAGHYTELNFNQATDTADTGNDFLGQMVNGSLTVTWDDDGGAVENRITIAAPSAGTATNADFPYDGPDGGGNAVGGANDGHLAADGSYAERDGFAAGVVRLLYVGDGMKANPVGGAGMHYTALETAVTDGSAYEGPTGLATMGTSATFRMADPATLKVDSTSAFINYNADPGPHSDTSNRHTHLLTTEWDQQDGTGRENNILTTNSSGTIGVETMFIDGILSAPGETTDLNFSGSSFQIQDPAFQFNMQVNANGVATNYAGTNAQSVTMGYGALNSTTGLVLSNSSQMDKFYIKATDGAWKGIGGCDNNQSHNDVDCTGTFQYGAKHWLVHGRQDTIHTSQGFNTPDLVTGDMTPDNTWVATGGSNPASVGIVDHATLETDEHKANVEVGTWVTTPLAICGGKLALPVVDTTTSPVTDGQVGTDNVGGVDYLYINGSLNDYDINIENE